MFKEKGPTAYQKSRDNADRVLSFELPDTLSVLAPTRDLLPKLFEWRDDMYVSGGRVVEHYSKWNEPLESSAIAFARMTFGSSGEIFLLMCIVERLMYVNKANSFAQTE
jgi:hypothetical protein